HAQPGTANCLLVEALRGDQLEDLAGPAGVDRADFADQLRGNKLCELMQRGSVVRHRLAQPGQQPAWRRHNFPQASTRCRAAKAATACPTSSWMIPAVGCSAVTMPTDCPAITEPLSTSPSMTARRSAPAQKCSISSWASSLLKAPAWKRSRVSAWCRRKRRVPSFVSPRTGITGNRSSNCTEGTASLALARRKARLKLG